MNGLLYVLFIVLGTAVGFGISRYLQARHEQRNADIAQAQARLLREEAATEIRRLSDTLAADARRELEGTKARLDDDLQRAREQLEVESERRRLAFEQEAERGRHDLAEGRVALREGREELKRDREKIEQIEERLTRRGEQQDARALRLDENEEQLDAREAELEAYADTLSERAKALEHKLHEIAQLSREQATEIIFHKLDSELEREKAMRVRAAIEQANSEAKRKAQNILAQAVQRSASEVSAAISVSVVPIPTDAMKGRIIGREGRNIRAFEALTGVDLIIDDTPEAVLLSSFNPMRREVAKLALVELVSDGRIHPARIEEVVHKAQQEMQTYIRERGEEGALEAEVVGLKPGMIQLLGRMHFRTSYGQNILKHSVQVAHMAGLIAAELGLDVQIARRAGLLHDIGKSIDREIEGTHTEIGAQLGRRFGEGSEVIDAIAHHHDLELSETLYPVLVNAADAISAARPGARRETLESYLKRLEGLEAIASSFPGVEKSYAIQAGREVRIIVEPDRVNDASAVLLARDIAQRIERDMEYPGQVQVTVVRESRAVEYAR